MIAAEFKRCGNGINADTCETVCSFLNHFGGDIYLGVDDGIFYHAIYTATPKHNA